MHYRAAATDYHYTRYFSTFFSSRRVFFPPNRHSCIEIGNSAKCIHHHLRINSRLVSGSFRAMGMESGIEAQHLFGPRLMFTRQCYQSDIKHHGANVAGGTCFFSYMSVI